MSRAEELADALDAMRIDPALCHHMVVPEVEAAAAELRRLAALEKAIMDAEPVAWDVYVAEADNGYLVDSLDDPQLIDDCTNHDASVTPLYTLKGIK